MHIYMKSNFARGHVLGSADATKCNKARTKGLLRRDLVDPVLVVGRKREGDVGFGSASLVYGYNAGAGVERCIVHKVVIFSVCVCVCG